MAWFVLMRRIGRPLTVRNFSRFFTISRAPKDHFFYVSPDKKRHFMGLVGSSMGKSHVCKARYVYLRYAVDSLRPSFGFRVPRKWLRDTIDMSQFKTRHIPSWCEPYENVEKEAFIPPNCCLVEPILRLAGISSIDPPGGFRGCRDLDWWVKLSCCILRKNYIEQLKKSKNQKESSVVAKHEVKGHISVLNLAEIYDPANPPEVITPYDPAKRPAPRVEPSVVLTAASSETVEANRGEEARDEPIVAPVVVPVVAEAAVDPMVRLAPSSSLWELRDRTREDSSDSLSPSDVLVRIRKVNLSDPPISSKRQRADDDNDEGSSRPSKRQRIDDAGESGDQQVMTDFVTLPPVLP